MGVFEDFSEVDFEFLKIDTASIYGNTILEKTKLRGIFKTRHGLNQDDRGYNEKSLSTMHVHPEDFEGLTLIGNGIRHDGRDYIITDCRAGVDFSSGSLEFYKLTLERAEFYEN